MFGGNFSSLNVIQLNFIQLRCFWFLLRGLTRDSSVHRMDALSLLCHVGKLISKSVRLGFPFAPLGITFLNDFFGARELSLCTLKEYCQRVNSVGLLILFLYYSTRSKISTRGVYFLAIPRDPGPVQLSLLKTF